MPYLHLFAPFHVCEVGGAKEKKVSHAPLHLLECDSWWQLVSYFTTCQSNETRPHPRCVGVPILVLRPPLACMFQMSPCSNTPDQIMSQDWETLTIIIIPQDLSFNPFNFLHNFEHIEARLFHVWGKILSSEKCCDVCFTIVKKCWTEAAVCQDEMQVVGAPFRANMNWISIFFFCVSERITFWIDVKEVKKIW